jgi:hypothetical protein
MAEIIERRGVGVAVKGFSSDELAQAARTLAGVAAHAATYEHVSAPRQRAA